MYNDPDRWKIMECKIGDSGLNPLDIAKLIVREGFNSVSPYPIGSFGDLITVDRAEIESFCSIKNIITEYINSKKITCPLSIAVFGSPGSGKSFGIIQIANNIDKERIKKLEFNVSQFTSIIDLISAFHVIRDCSLKGIIPVVFFDEFDCKFENSLLGWLRYFLVPMQDGKFLDHGRMHPIGKSIFVFAGGVFENFTEFCNATGIDPNLQKNSNVQTDFSEKCRDFIRRLRGYVNILGLNPKKGKTEDGIYLIRRAIILRSLIERKAQFLITPENGSIKAGTISPIKFDENLLELLLIDYPDGVRYKHEIRSMEAILDMSMLRHEMWNIASLPSKEQLELHIEVDFNKFYRRQRENFSKKIKK